MLTLIPAWINNHTPSKVRDEIPFAVPNFNGCIVDVWEWISNFTIHFIRDVYRIMHVPAWWILYVLTRELFWCLFPELCSNKGNKHQNNTRVSALTVPRESTYIILFLTRHKESINDDKNDDLHASTRVTLPRFTFCWWRHNRLLMTAQWTDNCDAITWIMISNSLDIDFIHGDIQGRSCKKITCPWWDSS